MLTANSYFQNMKLGPIQLLPHWHFPFFLILLIIFCCPFCPPLSVAHLGLPYHQHGGLQCRHLCTENGASRKILSVLNGESTIHVTKSGANQMQSLFVPQREHENRPRWIESKAGIRHVVLRATQLVPFQDTISPTRNPGGWCRESTSHIVLQRVANMTYSEILGNTKADSGRDSEFSLQNLPI